MRRYQGIAKRQSVLPTLGFCMKKCKVRIVGDPRCKGQRGKSNKLRTSEKAIFLISLIFADSFTMQEF